MSFEGVSMAQLLWAVNLAGCSLDPFRHWDLSNQPMFLWLPLDNAAPSDENNELIETLKQFWETEANGILHHVTDTHQHDRTKLFLPLFSLKTVIMKLSSPESKLMLTFLLISVCVIIVWGHCNIDSDLSQNYFKSMIKSSKSNCSLALLNWWVLTVGIW